MLHVSIDSMIQGTSSASSECLTEAAGDEIKFSNSVDAFDYLWSVGDKISKITFDDISHCSQEFFDTAANWPQIVFLAYVDHDLNLISIGKNVILLSKPSAEILPIDTVPSSRRRGLSA